MLACTKTNCVNVKHSHITDAFKSSKFNELLFQPIVSMTVHLQISESPCQVTNTNLEIV